MGIELMTRVVRHAAQHGSLPSHPQDERFATKAPMIKRSVSLVDERQPTTVSLVVTAIVMVLALESPATHDSVPLAAV